MRIKFFSDTNLQLFVNDAENMGYDLEVNEGALEVECTEGIELEDLAIDYSAEIVQFG